MKKNSRKNASGSSRRKAPPSRGRPLARSAAWNREEERPLTPQDLGFLREALALAELGRGLVSPNPMVGALVVKGGRIVGAGFHTWSGRKHGEALAIEHARRAARGATLYLNLEPCCHQGRTAPCTDAILRAGIRRVVASIADPNPLVSGKGFARLRAAGVQVQVGGLAAEAERLNEAFLHRTRTGMPLVTGKAALTLDGRVATHRRRSQWISSEASRRIGHRLRGEMDAVLVGIGTVLADDPSLDGTGPDGEVRHPLKVILDSMLRIPREGRLVKSAREAPLRVYCSPGGDPDRRRALIAEGVEVVPIEGSPGGILPLRAVLRDLAARGVSSLLVEGGSEVLTSFLEARLLDRLILFRPPALFGGETAPSLWEGQGVGLPWEALRLRDIRRFRVGQDEVLEGCLESDPAIQAPPR